MFVRTFEVLFNILNYCSIILLEENVKEKLNFI